MKRPLFLIMLIFSLLAISGGAHPVHVTVTNIEYNASKNIFEVSIKIFTDDLEHAVYLKEQKEIGLIKNSPVTEVEAYLLRYVYEQFQLFINNKPIALSNVKLTKYTSVENATWLYMEFNVPSKIKQLSIQNNLLNELFPDMTNLVIIHWNNNEQGLTFTKNKTRIDIA